MNTIVAAVLLTVPLASSAGSQNKLPSQRIIVRVTNVHTSPGVWSGTIAATQQVDGLVTGTSSREFRAGQQVSLHVFLLKGYAIFDPVVPKLSDAIRADTSITVRLGPRCTSSVLLPDVSVGPACITIAVPLPARDAAVLTTLCALVRSPSNFNGKRVRFSAAFENDGIEHSALTSTECESGIAPYDAGTHQNELELAALDSALDKGMAGTLDKNVTAEFVGVFDFRPQERLKRILHLERVMHLTVTPKKR